MIRLPPKSTLTDTLFPDTTLVRSRSGGRRGTSSAPARPAWIPSLNIWCCDVAAIGREGQAVVQAIINIGIKQPISLLGPQIGFIIKHQPSNINQPFVWYNRPDHDSLAKPQRITDSSLITSCLCVGGDPYQGGARQRSGAGKRVAARVA